jgi:hypothetical protein
MNLVEHAKHELKLAGVEKEFADPVLDMVRIFSDMGHSGASANYVRRILDDLLQYKNLIGLTDDPDEWVHHGAEMWGEGGGIWQNKRNSKAFSRDGGKHYWLLDEKADANGVKGTHTSHPASIKIFKDNG